MFKLVLVCTTLIASIFSGSATVIGSGFDPEDEARAWADRSSASAEYGSAEQAIAMLRRGVAAVSVDKFGAIAKFNNNNPEFRDRDLFVFCFNAQDGKYTAHEAMIGRDVRTFRDSKGRTFGQEMYRAVTDGKIVTVDFMAPLPGSTNLASRRAYVTRIGDQVCGVSAFQFSSRDSKTH
jgi:hypothetical protein